MIESRRPVGTELTLTLFGVSQGAHPDQEAEACACADSAQAQLAAARNWLGVNGVTGTRPYGKADAYASKMRPECRWTGSPNGPALGRPR